MSCKFLYKLYNSNEDFCKQRNIYIYDHYTDDGVSGATFDRPNFNRMIKDIIEKTNGTIKTYELE